MFLLLLFPWCSRFFVCWVSRGNPWEAELHDIVVAMLKVGVEVDPIISHGIDLASALELEVCQVCCGEIDPNNGAGI
jgi:hypothetical protein